MHQIPSSAVYLLFNPTSPRLHPPQLLGLREANAALQQAADRATKNVPAGIAAGADGGLWSAPKLVDAFVASLSMILVSEVSL